MQRQQIGHSFLAVQDVVQPVREAVDVLTVERGDERGVERGHHPVRDLVALVLDVLHTLAERLTPVEVLGELHERARTLRNQPGGRLK